MALQLLQGDYDALRREIELLEKSIKAELAEAHAAGTDNYDDSFSAGQIPFSIDSDAAKLERLQQEFASSVVYTPDPSRLTITIGHDVRVKTNKGKSFWFNMAGAWIPKSETKPTGLTREDAVRITSLAPIASQLRNKKVGASAELPLPGLTGRHACTIAEFLI